MKTKSIFKNYNIEIELKHASAFTLNTDDDIENIIHSIIELFEDNTANNKIDDIIQEKLYDVLFFINNYDRLKQLL